MSISKEESQIITCIRSLAMFLIVLSHYWSWLGWQEWCSQFLVVGVPIFFMLSGYLYGQKDIKDIKKWYLARFKTIVIPLYVFYILMSGILLCLRKFGEFDIVQFLKLLLNLQGLWGGQLGNVDTGSLWFITFILICYLLTPLLQKFRAKMTWGKLFGLICLLSAIEIVFILSISPEHFMVSLPGVIFYIFAYYFGYLWNKQVHLKFYIILSFLMVITIAVRLILKFEADSGDILVGKFYDRVYVSYSQGLLGFWIFITSYWILNKLPKIRVMIYPAFLKCDKLSYYIYIVHCSFLRGVLNLNQATNSLLVNTLLFLMCTILLSIIIKAISDMIMNKSFKIQTSR